MIYFSAATDPGSVDRPNEDWVAASPYAAVVLDGVTVFDEAATACRHGTPWYVNQLGMRLLAGASAQDPPLDFVLADAISAVADLHTDICDLGQISAPSAAVAAVRIGKRSVEYLVLADVTMVLRSQNGLEVVTDQRVEDTVRDLESIDDVGDEVMKRRERYRNRDGGYWVAAADPAAAAHAKTGQIKLKEFKSVALMSDGATRLVTPFEQATWADILNDSVKIGPASIINNIRTIEASDTHGSRWSRFKLATTLPSRSSAWKKLRPCVHGTTAKEWIIYYANFKRFNRFELSLPNMHSRKTQKKTYQIQVTILHHRQNGI